MRSELKVFILINVVFFSYGQEDLGTRCTAERTKTSGICKRIEDCPSIIDDIINKKLSHTRCGFVEKTEIVCCPEEIIVNQVNKVNTTISRISEKKCEEYKSFVFEEALPPSLLIEPPKKALLDKCGHKTIPLVIPYLYYTQPREFPHMALIGFDSENGKIEWLCSGTLISDEYVLIAAHCANSRINGNPKYVRLGEHNFDSDDDSRPENFNISSIFIHPDYKASSFYNDIALVKLSRKVQLNPYKRPACLPTTDDYVEKRNIISTGWEQNFLRKNSLPRLKKVIMQLLNSSLCNATYEQYFGRRLKEGIRADSQICTESKDVDILLDSSGPIQIYHPDHYCMYVVIGVRSLGVSFARPNEFPDVSTNVFHYLDWIESIVW